MVRFPDSYTDESGVVKHGRDNPIITRAWKDRPAHKIEGLTAPGGVGDVFEGPIVGALVSVFKQLDDIGARRHGRDQ